MQKLHPSLAHRRLIPWLALITPVLLLVLLSLLPQWAAQTQAGGLAQVALAKSVSATSVESGVPFEYILSYRCASIDDNCVAPVITDELPPQIQFIANSATSTADIQSIEHTPGPGGTGGIVRWTFKDPLLAGNNGVLRFQVRFPLGTVPGTTVDNTATFTATNAVPVTTPPVRTTATGKFEMFAAKNGGRAVVGFPASFSLEICSPDLTGGVRFTSVVMTDTLPIDAKFVTAEGTKDVDWVYTPAVAPDTGGTVRFQTLPTVQVGGCTTRSITLQYDSLPAEDPENQLTVTGIPEGCGDAANLPPHCEGQTVRTLTAIRPFEVIAPFADLQASKLGDSESSFDGVEALPGETVTYTLGARNNGFVLLPDVTITDSLPSDQLDLVSWTAGGLITRPVTVTYQVNNSGNWITFPGSPFASNATLTVASLGLPGGSVVTDLRWEIGDLPVFAPPWSAIVVGNVKDTILPEFPPATFNNCSVVTTTQSDVDEACREVRIIAERAIPRIAKTFEAGNFLPLDFVDYRVELRNAGVAHLPLENPVIADLIPAEFAYVTGSAEFDVDDSVAGAPAPQLEVLGDFNGSGRTLLRWSWNNGSAFTLAPGESLVVRYRVQIIDGTPPGDYSNLAALLDWSSPADPDDEKRDQRSILLCTGDSAYVDTLDLDGDGNTTEESCQSVQPVRVGVALAMSSEKFVRGQIDCATYGTPACEDGDYNKLGLTVPGGPVDYRIFITNTSNVSVTDLVVIDTFPRVGDTGVIDLSDRLSQWRPNLQEAVEAPNGVPLTIFYSTQATPCRPELGVNPSGCTNAQWTDTLPADPTSVQAIKLDFCTYENGQRTTNCLLLPRFGSLQFDWPMVAPNDAPASPSCLTPAVGAEFDPADHPDCKIAWNSFGFTASESRNIDGQPGNDPGALDLLPAEPNKVGMRLAPGSLYAVGDLVWLDVAGLERDGIQQPVEQTSGGVSGVRVELYGPEDNLLDFRITGPNNAGQPGYYLFPNLPAGRYKVRFYLPPGYSATLPNVGSDDMLDSDGIGAGSNSFGPYYETEVFDLPNNLTNPSGADLSRDFGLWRATDYGDNPVQYPTKAISLTNPADAARHVIVDGLYFGNTVDAEGDGQPGNPATGDDLNGAPDDEDGVTFPALAPCNSAQIQLTAQTGNQGAFYGAFFDWNGDGVFNVGTDEDYTGSIGTESKLIDIQVPCNAFAVVYTRFRIAWNPAEVAAGTGTAYSGEVEDYLVEVPTGEEPQPEPDGTFKMYLPVVKP